MAVETTTFEIKTHEHPFTEEYVLLKREIEAAKGVPEEYRSYVDQAALESLQNYRETSDTFHPQNHWYAFEGDELIGYAHIWPTYNENDVEEIAGTDIPGVKGDRPDVFQALTDAVTARAKELGIKTLRYEIPRGNTVAIEEAKKFGFSEGELRRARALLNPNNVNVKEVSEVEVFEFDEEKHLEDQVSAYEIAGITREFVINQNKQIREFGDRVLSWKVAYQDGKLTGHSIAFKYSEDGNRAQVSIVTKGVESTDEAYENAINAIFASHLSVIKDKNIDEIEIFIPNSRLDLLSFYENLGIQFDKIYAYTKEVSDF